MFFQLSECKLLDISIEMHETAIPLNFCVDIFLHKFEWEHFLCTQCAFY